MIWELLATVFAGLGAAGIIMGLRMIIKKIPKWTVPASAGLGMLLFQIYSEYTWFEHTESLLPQGTVVVAKVDDVVYHKPWTKFIPLVERFIAADVRNAQKNQQHPSLVQVELYFFERRMSAHHLSIVIDCTHKRQANFDPNLTPATGTDDTRWTQTRYTENLVTLVCRP